MLMIRALLSGVKKFVMFAVVASIPVLAAAGQGGVSGAGTPALHASEPCGTINVHSFGAKGDGVTDDTAAISKAISAAFACGGGTVLLPSGTYAHTGITLPPTGTVSLQGDGRFNTTLLNTSRDRDSIAAIGAGSTYPTRFSIRGMLITATTLGTQSGIHVRLGHNFEVQDVVISNHGVGVKSDISWRYNFTDVVAQNNGVGWQFTSFNNMQAVPITLINCSAANNLNTGVFLNQVSALVWIGGEIGGSPLGLQIGGDAGVGGILFAGVSFEGNRGVDVLMGYNGTGPTGVHLDSCRFIRTAAQLTAADSTAIDVEQGGGIVLTTPYFSNYPAASPAHPLIKGSNAAGSFVIMAPVRFNCGTSFLVWGKTEVAASSPFLAGNGEGVMNSSSYASSGTAGVEKGNAAQRGR